MTPDRIISDITPDPREQGSESSESLFDPDFTLDILDHNSSRRPDVTSTTQGDAKPAGPDDGDSLG